MPLKYLPPLLALLLGCLVAIAGGGEEARVVSAPLPDQSLTGKLQSEPGLAGARDLLAQASLTRRLSGKRPYTLLLPTDRALANQRGLIDELLRPSARGRLRRVMRFNVLPGRHRFLRGGDELKTLTSQPVSVSVYRGRGWVEDAQLSRRIRASNGYIFLTDALLIPRGDPAR